MIIEKRIDDSFTADITLASLAAGAARQSAFIANDDNRPSIKVTVKITSGAVAPTLGTIYEVWLLRRSAAGNADDDVGAVDAAYPVPPTLPRNATLIGAISVTADADQAFIGTFIAQGPLGDDYGIAIANRTDQAISATEADHNVTIEPFADEVIQPLHIGAG